MDGDELFIPHFVENMTMICFWQFSTEHVTFMQKIALNDINNNIVVFAGGFNWTFAGLTKNHLVLLCHIFKDLTELSWSVAVVTS